MSWRVGVDIGAGAVRRTALAVLMTARERYPRFAAPSKDGQTLSVPPWDSSGELVAANRAYRGLHNVEIQGRRLGELATEAREALLAEAISYTRSYVDVEQSPRAESPLIVTGHQPDLVHPGVWLKNVGAAELAERVGGTAVSLVIDSDLCRAASIRVPTGTAEEPRVESVAYDRSIDATPYEERTIVDRGLWDSFGERSSQLIRPLVDSPLVGKWWSTTVRPQETANLGLALVQGRHRLESQWGIRSLEIPQSRICRTGPFRWFLIHLLANAGKFRAAHNEALAEYRRAHRIRNHAQPMPNLAKAGEDVEAPFWIWTAADPRRRALYVRRRGEELLLSDRDDFAGSLPLAPEGDPRGAIELLAEWESAGIKLRTRALMTTMYARLVLADVFIHGIGGAKYDQVTDGICERFYSFAPAPYSTMSGTLRLPIARRMISSTNERELRQELRELAFHPEGATAALKLAGKEQSDFDAIVSDKLKWVQAGRTIANAAERHRQIARANEALQTFVAPRRVALEQELASTIRQAEANKVLESREYPFCLFPRDYLREFLLDFSARMA